ncbi:uncharacterized protein LOC121734898 [Aricia agestis]|uniref:uncharacterized protein LOC121734898 n=1 Tax=Aricia agestis TaxID=91739 RepID=UPI001C204DE3|nr:uncharacterized protein LOC121734898 [Aricia agestis]
MRCECPEFRRCCLCLPLRFGLIGTAWIKLVLDALCLMYVAFAIHVDGRRLPVFPIVFLSVATVVVVLDVGFNGVLLRGCHKKDPVLLRLFYRYSLFLLGLNIAFVLAIIIMDIVISVQSPFLWIVTLYTFFTFLVFCVLSIIIHLYLSILVRSEVQKLEATTQFQFTNTAAEAACTMAPGYTDTNPAANRPDNV